MNCMLLGALGISSLLTMGLLSPTASAAELPLPVKAPIALPPPLPVWTWTGFYGGGNCGGSWGSSPAKVDFYPAVTDPLLFSERIAVDGFVCGGQTGYNYQIGIWVVGLETDFDGSGQRGNTTINCPACSEGPVVTTAITERLNWFGTVRPRFGVTITPLLMVYATGGLAYGELTDSGSSSQSAAGYYPFSSTPFSFRTTSVGGTVGAGVEGQLFGNWTWRVEYLFMELREPSGSVITYNGPFVTCASGPGCVGPIRITVDPIFTDNIVRGGINYKF